MDKWRYLATLRYHRRAFITIFALLAIASGGALLAHHAPTDLEIYDKPTTVAETEFQVGAIAKNPSQYHDKGEVLSNQTVFLLNSTPTATVWSKTSFSKETKAVTHNLSLRRTASVNNETFWTRSQPLDSSTATNTTSISTAEGLNMTQFKAQTYALEEPLGPDGEVNAELVVTTTATFADGNTHKITQRYEIQNTSEGIFYVGVPKHVERTTLQSSPSIRLTTLDGSPGADTKVFFGVSLAGMLFCLALGQLTRLREVPLVATPKGHWIRAVKDNQNWISTGTLTDLTDLHLVELESIDEAITAAKNTTVPAVYDEEKRVVAVFTADTVYYCTGPGLQPDIVTESE